jgi:hypothetical protein
MRNEIEKCLTLCVMNMSNLTGLVDLEGRHDFTSVLTTLHVASDVTCDPISHTFAVDICILGNQGLVVVEVIIELVWIFFAQANGSNFDK